ncbi:MAG: macro domain-containing protein, partial [Fibrobacter sp.]|nr:macro domain-containing protein [Fibrobacter sp.]
MAFKIIRNDITKVKADIIVNSANTKPICAGYRTDAAIYEAAGYEEMLAARQKIGDIEVGHAEVTPAFNLHAKYVIHSVGPMWVDGKSGESEALQSCYRECLKKAVTLGAKSIAFPLISTGAFGFPKDKALGIVTEIAREFTSEHKLDVILVVYDEESFELTSELTDFVEAYIDEHYVGRVYEERLGKLRFLIAPEECEQRLDDAGACDMEPVCEAPRMPSEEDELVCAAEKAHAAEVFRASKTKFETDLENKLKDFEIQTFGKRLAHYLYEKKLDSATVYNAVFMDRRQFSKLLGDKTKLPRRETVLAIAIGMKLNVLETKDLLSY